jgi:hypothetical protein
VSNNSTFVEVGRTTRGRLGAPMYEAEPENDDDQTAICGQPIRGSTLASTCG